jgi:hypothetical protein
MLSGSNIYGRFSSASCSNVLRAETKTECHKLKDDRLIKLLTLVPETGSHSDSLVIVTAVVELMIVNNLQHQSRCSRERRKEKGDHISCSGLF